MRIVRNILVSVFLFLVGCTTQSAPPAPPPKPPLEFLGEWGPHGEGPGQLSQPTGIATDSVGNVYIADAGSRFIHKFDPNGRPLLSFQDLYLKSPRGIAVDEGGGIYVTDEKANLLFIFRTDGSRYLLMRSAGGHRFQNPSRVAVNSSGEIFLLDAESILAFYPSLRTAAAQRRVLNGVSKEGPGAPSDLHADWGRHVYTVSGDKVEKRDLAAQDPLWKISLGGVIPAAQDPSEAAIAGSDRLLFVVDESLRRITIVTSDGTTLFSEPIPSLPPGEKAVSIVDLVWSPRRELFLLDRANARVLRFRVNL